MTTPLWSEAAGGDPRLSTDQRYLTGSETLRLTVYNGAAGVTVQMSGRRYDPDANGISEFSHRLTPSTSRVASTFDVPAGCGWLLGCAVRVIAGAPLDGQTYAVVEIGNGSGSTFNPLDVLIADTITAAKRAAWPGSVLRGPLDGRGAVRLLTGTNPGAGLAVNETVPTGARWQLLYVKATLTTSAAVANRVPNLSFDDGTNYYCQFDANVTTTASSARDYLWAHGMDVKAAASAAGVTQGMGTTPALPAGHRIHLTATGLDAADAFSSIRYLVLEWLEGN